MAKQDAMKRWRQEFARRLNECRPDRYLMGEKFVEGEELKLGEDYPADLVETDDDDLSPDWMLEVAAEMAPSMPVTDKKVRQVFADAEAKKLDATALRSANDRIRKMHRSGQPELDWLDASDLPVSVEVREPVWGGENRVRIRTYRVRLGLMKQADWDAAEIAERRRAASESRSRNEKCDAMQWFSERQRAAKACNWTAWIEGACGPAADEDVA